MLAHFTNVTPAVNLQEPVYLNLFEVTFKFPVILGLPNKEMDYMMQQATNISFDLTTPLETSAQKFKFSDRIYLKTPSKTSHDFSIKFNVNVDDKNSMVSWNLLKKWYDLAWNSQTGELHYKRDMIGTIVGHLHDREGVVIRRVEYKNVQIKKISAMTLSWASAELYDGDVDFVADYAIDQYYDIQT